MDVQKKNLPHFQPSWRHTQQGVNKPYVLGFLGLYYSREDEG